MFDTAKIQRMTTELEKFSSEHDNVYVVPEFINLNIMALFKRLNLQVKALMFDDTQHREIFGIPVLQTSEATTRFNERTGIIILTQKPVPLIKTTFDFAVNGRLMSVPALTLSSDEALAIYSRLMVMIFLQQQQQDFSLELSAYDLLNIFARGVNTFLEPSKQTVKFQYLTEKRFDFKYDFDDAAIVIQGPIAYDNNYTAETFKIYRSIYPNAPIVVSTWKNEATNTFRQECRKNSVVLLENEPPNFPGPWNINMQLESSLQGVKFVRENTNAKFVLKCRTDQRINKSDFLTYFRNLILTFPPLGDKLHGRILLLEASKWLPFRTTDFLSFGYVEDIFKLYDIPRHGGQNDEVTYRKNHDMRFIKLFNIMRQCKPLNHVPPKSSKLFRKINNIGHRLYEVEAYILKNFYERNIAPIDRNKFIETGWKFMREYLVIVGIADIFLDWPKYELYIAHSFDSFITNGINFSRWLDLYRNFNID